MDDHTKTANEPFLIGTYNILNPFHAVKWDTAEGLNDQGADNWDEWRGQEICDNIEANRLDICALQEVSKRTAPQLIVNNASGNKMAMTEVYFHWTEDQGGEHGVCVLYNTDRFKLLRDRGLKTSAEKYRYGAMVDLEDLRNGCVVRVISVHLKGYNPYQEDLEIKAQEQQRGDQELKEYLNSALQDVDLVDGVFVLGDYNEDSAEMERRGAESRQGQLIENGFSWTGVPQVTETRSGRQIDWIFYRDHHEGLYKIKSVQAPQNTAASDHALTVVRHECSLNALTRFMI